MSFCKCILFWIFRQSCRTHELVINWAEVAVKFWPQSWFSELFFIFLIVHHLNKLKIPLTPPKRVILRNLLHRYQGNDSQWLPKIFVKKLKTLYLFILNWFFSFLSSFFFSWTCCVVYLHFYFRTWNMSQRIKVVTILNIDNAERSQSICKF